VDILLIYVYILYNERLAVKPRDICVLRNINQNDMNVWYIFENRYSPMFLSGACKTSKWQNVLFFSYQVKNICVYFYSNIDSIV